MSTLVVIIGELVHIIIGRHCIGVACAKEGTDDLLE